MNRFLRDAGEAFVIAFAVVAVDDFAELVESVGTKEQLVVGLAAIGRAAVAAGLRAALPMLVAHGDRSRAAVDDRLAPIHAAAGADPADRRPRAERRK